MEFNREKFYQEKISEQKEEIQALNNKYYNNKERHRKDLIAITTHLVPMSSNSRIRQVTEFINNIMKVESKL